MSNAHTLSLPNVAATKLVAQRIAAALQVGDVLLLDGPVGAGKSYFCRALIQSLQSEPEDVPSPTFTLVQTYDTQKGEVWHADLYRLGGPDEAIELGLIDAMETAICLIEWPDRLGELAPDNATHLSFNYGDGDTARALTCSGRNTHRLLEAIHA